MKVCKRGITKNWKGLAALLLLTASVIFCGNHVQAAGRPVSISSCQIAGGNVTCTLRADSVVSGDDGKYYIYANEVYQDGPVGGVSRDYRQDHRHGGGYGGRGYVRDG